MSKPSQQEDEKSLSKRRRKSVEQGIAEDRGSKPARRFGKYHSVEFSLEGFEYAHQFRIWNSEPASMFVLVKQSSVLLQRLKVGDMMKMKYYTNDSLPQAEYMDTKICHIIREDQGKFRGHCLIGLAVAEARS